MKSSSLYVDRSTNQLITEGASNDRGLLFSPDFKKTRVVLPYYGLRGFDQFIT